MTDYQAEVPNTQYTNRQDVAEHYGSIGIQIDPLYSATTVAELRAEITAYREADESMQEELGRQVSLRMAAERRVAELLQAVRELQIAESDVRIHEAMNPRSRNYRLPIYEVQRQARERLSALTKESP